MMIELNIPGRFKGMINTDNVCGIVTEDDTDMPEYSIEITTNQVTYVIDFETQKERDNLYDELRHMIKPNLILMKHGNDYGQSVEHEKPTFKRRGK